MKKSSKTDKLDILAIGAHPDDVEFGCAGLLIKAAKNGLKTGIVDFSLAELSTNGTVEERQTEAGVSAKVMGVAVRENLGWPNGFFANNKETQDQIVRLIRKYRPDTVLMPHNEDRHPDHVAVQAIVLPALFISGLVKYETGQEKWRPKQVFAFRLWNHFKPDFVLDISDEYPAKLKAMLCYQSQFVLEKGRLPSKDNTDGFQDYWKAIHSFYGYDVGAKYGEPYKSLNVVGVSDHRNILGSFS